MSSSSHQFQLSNVAVIVAGKNEEDNIRACIDSILVAASDLAQVIVINDGSSDRTGEILKTFGDKIHVITTTGVGPSKARNEGIAFTQHRYVAFADADCMVDAKWLGALVRALNGQTFEFVSVGGAQCTSPNAQGWDAFHASFLKCIGFISDYVHSGEGLVNVKHNPTCNVLYEKQAILRMEGFDEKLWPCEDLDLDIRLGREGKKMLFEPGAIVFHHRPNSFRGFMKMMYRYGFGHAQLVKKHGPCQKTHAMPLVFLLGIALLSVSSTQNFLIAHWVWIAAGYYLFMLMLSKSLYRALIYGVYLVPTVVSWHIGFFVGLFQRKKITTK